ncbi:MULTISPECIES: ABC transporter permease [unclassified Rhizobium]|uniref:ABC transporter permease n=1 Tax=unclassified Rhizobium TaxID=2613769 RepID=UPI001ADB8FE2|nr:MULTISPECIES: ABC transporter permease [unclassified Rhizobium]MBO9127888.1 ABC transporter permease [Rhizobium sp. 16-488-2b]MBO9178282.1 ABC transporter permease [Rhizobium sp. 16-488-2a]
MPNSAATAVKQASPLASFTRGILTRYATLLLLLVLIVVFASLSSQFLTARNIQNILVVQTVVSCVAFAALFPLIVGEFDLSLGYLIGFVVMLGAYLGGAGFNASVVVPAMVIAGTGVGFLSGLLTVTFKISSFISTLGIGILLSGLTLALSGGQVLFTGIPQFVLSIGQTSFIGLAVSVWFTLLIALVLFYLLEQMPMGRKFYAVGGSERVAFLAGIKTKWVKVLAFTFAGLIISIGGLFELGQSGAASAGFGPDLLLPGYAAAFLGVTTYKPGYFNVPGTLVAILLLAVGFNGLNLLGAPFWMQPIFNGLVLIIAVITARSEARQLKRG